MNPAAVDQFLQEARRALADSAGRLTFDSRLVIAIAADPALADALRKRFVAINDPDLQAIVRYYLGNLADDLDNAAEATDIYRELVDRVALAPSVPVAVAGLIGLAGGAVVAAAPMLLIGGIFGIAVSGVASAVLRIRARYRKADSRKIRQLKESLK